MNYLRIPLLFLVMVSSLSAQEPTITTETTVNKVILDQWLHSGNPRLIAWAATFAQQTHDAEILAEMPSLLDHWVVPEIFGDEKSQASQKRAIGAVLDALIQENIHVPASTINLIADSYPAAASVLIGRLPLSESRQTLDDWVYGATGTWGGRTLARVASMMLAKDPGPSRTVWNGNLMGFVASVVGASEAELHIKIKATTAIGEGTGMGACGDSMGRGLTPGWPEVYSYFLSENDPQGAAHIVVDLDGDNRSSNRKGNLNRMAIVHVSFKSSSTAPPAAAHAQYIAREGQYQQRGGVELVESGNMPEFAQADPHSFWVAADAHERANGRTYTELQIALPRELDPAQRQELARDVTRELLEDRFAYTLAVHSPLAKDNIDQPHMHLMFSERVVDSNTQSLSEDRFFKRNGAKKDLAQHFCVQQAAYPSRTGR